MVVVKNEGNDSLRTYSEEGAFRKGDGGGGGFSRSTNSIGSLQQVVEGNVADAASKSSSPTEAKAVLNPDEGNSSSDDGGSGNTSCNYLGKVSRKQHRKLKRSLGSGFELVELSQLHGDCPPIVLQLGNCVVDPPTSATGGRSPPNSSSKSFLSPGGTITVATSRESAGSIVLAGGDELPPEEHWRDGLLGGFFFGGSFCSIGLPSLCCTGAALLQVMRALGWHPARSRQFLALAAIALLWASIPLAVFLHAYPVAAAALLLVLALEAAAAWRLRQIVRRRFNIDGSSACQDGVLSCLFIPCVVAQMLRHLRTTNSATPRSSGSCTHTSIVA